MKKSRSFFLVFIMSLAALFSGTALANKNNLPNLTPPDEFEILVKYLENNSILISNDALPIINADEVKKNLKNPKYHIIDIRNDSWFEYGHIKGAQNLKSEELLNYFENSITPKDFEKIILVCYSGQSASYFSGLLNIAGYDNVYSMKWGMSSWREDFAEGYWQKNIGNDYESQLETVENTKTEAGVQPTLNTGNSEGKDILHARLTELFKNPYKNYVVKFADVVENTDDFYIANFVNKEIYDLGHLAGAMNYSPGSSLNSTSDLNTIPTDQKVLVYSETGLEAAYIVAYLNVLGYDTANLAYGANGFINNKLKKQTGYAFTNKEINMYPVIE